MTEFSLRGTGSAGDDVAALVTLYAEEFEQLPAAWPLRSRRVTIGRDSGVECFLPVSAVSRQHAELNRTRDGWVIRDLGSRNGTLVDGVPVTECPLEPGAEIRVGNAVLKLVDHRGEDYAVYRLDGVLLLGRQRLCKGGTALVGGFVLDRLAAQLESLATRPLSVLVQGESGTGKEVVARELHRMSQRRGSFRAVNCAAIPANLLESELFGYRRGAFTGADRDHPGLFRSAHNGTLLLDEIGDMPLSAQAKLLRVLETKEVVPLGATTPERVDARIICATHRDLRQLLATEHFRTDLYARLAEATVALPPLRDRKEDIYQLVRALLARHGRPELVPDFSFMLAALHYDWPLNVRELEACIKRATALCSGPRLTAEDLPEVVCEAMADYGRPPDLRSRPVGDREGTTVPSADELRAVLARHGGNVAAVGRAFGKARMQVHRWMQRYGIDVSEYR